MKHGSGIKDRDDKSNGIEILMAEAFAKINPTDPLILARTEFFAGVVYYEGLQKKIFFFSPCCGIYKI